MIARADDCEICSLCGRRVPHEMITLHHLTPKERGGKPEQRVPMCRPCHKQVHALYGNKDLERTYADLPALRRDPQLQKFIRWIRKQPPMINVTTHMSNDHPHRARRR
jgi:5-methylcytosine-specific restriction endonuclease McrA